MGAIKGSKFPGDFRKITKNSTVFTTVSHIFDINIILLSNKMLHCCYYLKDSVNVQSNNSV